MNASEARKERGGSTLLERVKRDPVRAAAIDALVAAASVEHIVQSIMEAQNVNAAELARRINAKPPQISRDLHGGLSKATLGRIVTIAEALGYDFVPAFVPRSKQAKRQKFFAAYRRLLPESFVSGATSKAGSGKQAKPKQRKIA
jgi:transcriptional regulator with XRE-family HTH domain